MKLVSPRTRRDRHAVLALVAAGCLLAPALAACSSSGGTANHSPVKIGFITAKTGVESPGKNDAIKAAQARVDLANANGGVNGRKVELIVADSQSSPAGAMTATQSLISQGVVGIESDVTETDGAPLQYANAHHIPRIGIAGDAATVANSNYYSVLGSSGPSVPGNTSLGKFFQSLGVQQVAGVAWGISPVVVQLMKSPLASAKSTGVTTVLSDISPTPTTADFTPNALKIKSSNAEGLWSVMAVPSNVALAKAIGQQNVQLKAAVYDGNYESSVLQSAGQTLEGTYTQNPFAPMGTDATKQYGAALAKYAPGVFGGYLETYAWVSTDLMISGLQQAGNVLTAAGLTQGLHKLTSYSASGLLPSALNFAQPKSAAVNVEKCFWYPQVFKGGWVSSPNPVCGDLVSAS